MSARTHPRLERHASHRLQWLRAAVLGADDGIVSTTSLMIGLSAGSASSSAVITAGLAALVAGSLSMAAGEYVSVSSQADAERADLAKERTELEEFPDDELRELTDIYIHRGLDPELARTVAVQLSEHDALGAHLRDELNLTREHMARPIQAAVVSAISFAGGAAIPLITAALVGGHRTIILALSGLVALGLLGIFGARWGNANRTLAAVRVILGGGLAMLVSALIGGAIGTVG